MGGVLSGARPLLNLKERQVDLKYRETTVEGRRHEIEYIPQKTLRDTKIRLYFDIENSRPVRTQYKVRIKDDLSTDLAGGDYEAFPTVNSSLPSTIMNMLRASIYTLVGKFDEFKKSGGFCASSQLYALRFH